jgi:hypothetical protein
MSEDGRDRQNGRFLPGNPGGPGRPRRAIESDYLAALSEAVPTDTSRAIVAKAVEPAQAGDAKAREWLGAYLVGRPTGGGLKELAAAELAGYAPVETEAGNLALSKALFGALSRL